MRGKNPRLTYPVRDRTLRCPRYLTIRSRGRRRVPSIGTRSTPFCFRRKVYTWIYLSLVLPIQVSVLSETSLAVNNRFLKRRSLTKISSWMFVGTWRIRMRLGLFMTFLALSFLRRSHLHFVLNTLNTLSRALTKGGITRSR